MHIAKTPVAEWPLAKYKLLVKSYIPRRPGEEHEIIDPTHEITDGVFEDPFIWWNGKPGPHMEPTCDAGREAQARAGFQELDPTKELSLVLGEGAELQAKTADLMSALFALLGKQATLTNLQPPVLSPPATAPVYPAAAGINIPPPPASARRPRTPGQ
jgi:hypothetical protein